MALSYNEIRRRAAEFSHEFRCATRENSETHTFYNAFFNVFGLNRRRVASFEEPVKKLGKDRGRIDLFWKGTLLVEQKSAGLDLKKAYKQALDYFPGLKDEELPQYILCSDFQSFELYDLDEGRCYSFKLSELPKNVEIFGFIAGYRKREYKDQDPVNIKASELMGEIHDALKGAGYVGSPLELLLVRLLFCLFADDTGIFEKEQFRFYIEERTSEDGSDLGPKLVHLFQVLNTPKDRRSTKLDESLAAFEYINGDLFKENLTVADFDREIRAKLLKACLFDWSRISPAVFGSLFQSVMDKDKRRGVGAHYTTEANILKVIRPLFLDDLQAEFERIRLNKARLRQFHDKLGTLRFLDPACGCGNFLIIAYRELRRLETTVLKAVHGEEGVQLHIDIGQLSKIDVDKFYGIEIEEFPAKIAETALWLTDHLMNMELSQAFGPYYARIPLRKSPHIHHANALRLDWNAVIPAAQLSYIMGNPPFIGKQHRTDDQQADMELVFKGHRGTGILDYVTAWYLKAARFIQGTSIRCAFVSTNSITQGEQVPAIWKPLYTLKINIHFAHRTFAWGSEARGRAHVHVVIIGFGLSAVDPKRLFDYDDINGDAHETTARNINPYLIDFSDLIIEPRSTPIAECVPKMSFGNMPNDDGHLLMEDDEKKAFLKEEPKAVSVIKPLMGSDEFLNGDKRWCLWLKDASPADLRKLPKVLERVNAVKKYRLASKRQQTKELAKVPSLFGEIRQPSGEYILVPRHSSETRKYVPMGFLPSNVIVHDSCMCIPGGSKIAFGVLSSHMFTTWLRNIGGKIKSDYRISGRLVYNCFPWPLDATEPQKKAIAKAAEAILLERKKHKQSTLSDLYSPATMPADLVKAHRTLDRAVDRAYRPQAFPSERARMEFLFKRYEDQQSPLLQDTKMKRPKATKLRRLGEAERLADVSESDTL